MSRSRQLARDLLAGLEEAVMFARGQPTDVKVTTVIVRKGIRTRPDGLPEIYREIVQVRNGD